MVVFPDIYVTRKINRQDGVRPLIFCFRRGQSHRVLPGFPRNRAPVHHKDELHSFFSELSDQLDMTLESTKIIPFIQTSLAQSESASPKATELYAGHATNWLEI